MIEDKKLMEQAETGDLLLFRGNHLGGKLQRKWTHGHVDHAAMIVKLKKYLGHQLFILESVMVKGVGFTSWENFKRYNNIYDEVFYRKLNCKRDPAFYKRFDDFIELVQGNAYNINIKQFLF